ncbi:MAG: ribosome biogenesis factor YjgA [Methylococcales bacterium]|nr:ribosome biogenesis factor YjgA [Methylococcales bacterium]
MNDEYYPDENPDDDESVEYYAIRPNKTRLKKEIAAISEMAEEISRLSPGLIAEFELPEALEHALLDAGKLGQNAARKRLLKYITAQLRNIDLEAVQEKLARLKNRSAHAVREHHQAERWRDLLLADNGSEQLTALMSEFPQIDSQHLRQLQRNAEKEARESKPPKSARLIYKYLKDIISSQE